MTQQTHLGQASQVQEILKIVQEIKQHQLEILELLRRLAGEPLPGGTSLGH